MSDKVVKKRNWAFIMYPESAPENWKDILTQTGLPMAISPLHGSDVNEDGTPKKPHWHVIMCYQGPTAERIAQRISDSVHATHVQSIESMKGAYNYLTHEDNPEKFHYSKNDIIRLNGFDIVDFAEISKSEINTLKKKIQAIIIEKDFIEYSDLMDYLLMEDMSEEHDIASSNTLFFNSYITSRRHKIQPPPELPFKNR